jgi:hypothetical protein
MRAETETLHERSPSSQDVTIVEKDTTQSTASERSTTPEALTRADMILYTKSILDDDDHEVMEGRPASDEKNTSIPVDIREEPDNYIQTDDDTTDLGSVPDPPLNCALCQDDFPFQGQLVEHIEFVTQCRYPRDFLAIFHDHDHGVECHGGECNGEVDHALFYHVPSTCEYCGSRSLHECPESCQRPKLLFAKKRPPFCKKGPNWDAKTDHKIIIDDCKQEEIEVKMDRSPFRSLFFGR